MFKIVIFFDAKISLVTVSPVMVLVVKIGILSATGDACAVFGESVTVEESLPQPFKRSAALIKAAAKNFFVKVIISFIDILAFILGRRKLLVGRQGNCGAGRIS